MGDDFDQVSARRESLRARVVNDFSFHPAANDLTAARHEEVRRACREAALALIDVCPYGRELSSALTKLEEAMFHGNAAVARQAASGPPSTSRPDPVVPEKRGTPPPPAR